MAYSIKKVGDVNNASIDIDGVAIPLISSVDIDHMNIIDTLEDNTVLNSSKYLKDE